MYKERVYWTLISVYIPALLRNIKTENIQSKVIIVIFLLVHFSCIKRCIFKLNQTSSQFIRSPLSFICLYDLICCDTRMPWCMHSYICFNKNINYIFLAFLNLALVISARILKTMVLLLQLIIIGTSTLSHKPRNLQFYPWSVCTQVTNDVSPFK